MSALNARPSPELLPLDAASPADVVEISLLLPGWQVAALETAAHDRGLTAGQMVRRLIRDFFDGPEKADDAPW